MPKVAPPTIKGKSDLHKMQKKLGQVNEEVIDFMLTVVRNNDADIKLRTETAKTLAVLYKETTESIVKESLTKLLATSKLAGNTQSIGGTAYAAPKAVADFTSLQRFEGVDYSEYDDEDESFDARAVGSFTPE